jgi:chromosome segregation ATPase
MSSPTLPVIRTFEGTLPDAEGLGLKLASMARTLVRTLHLVQRLREDLGDAHEALHVAVAELADRDQALERSRSQVQHLRAEIRSMVSGRTLAAERQDLEHDERAAA